MDERATFSLSVIEALAGKPAWLFIPPTHNREPYDTQLSDTMVTHPSVELMPLGSTRSVYSPVTVWM